jgi:hypothetical protein
MTPKHIKSEKIKEEIKEEKESLIDEVEPYEEEYLKDEFEEEDDIDRPSAMQSFSKQRYSGTFGEDS